MTIPSINKTEIKPVRPFLRWAGSKSWLVKKELDNYLPKEFNNYHEGFLGGGSVFFKICPLKKAFLYDTNAELIETYSALKNDVEKVIVELRKFKNTEEEYYSVRSTTTNCKYDLASRFIYLNRTSFNGIYRVNSKGIYNVPYGKRKNVDIVTEDNLRRVSKALNGVELNNSDFETLLDKVQAKDLVFLDPPYTVAHEHNGFIAYNQKLFSLEDQKRLASLILRLNEIGAYYILTNASHSAIREIYSGLGSFQKISRYCKVGGRTKTRGMFNELLITNI